MKIKGSQGIHIMRAGDSIQLYSDPIPISPQTVGADEELGTPLDYTVGDTVTEHEYSDWERQPNESADHSIKLKMLTRTYYSKDDDKNYNFYMILIFSTTGQLIKVEGEEREVAFETTLHQHS